MSAKLIASKSWPWNISIYTYVVLVLLSFPSYQLFFQPNTIVLKNWQGLEEQARHPFSPNPFSGDEHEGQIAFRLLLPVLSHITGISMNAWFVVQHLAGLVFMALLARYLQKTFRESHIALAGYIAIASTYLFRGFFVDVMGYFDGIGWLFLLVGCLVPSAPLMGLSILLGAYVDERCIMALPLVVLYRIILRPDENDHPLFSPFARTQLLWGGLALAAIAGLRWYLSWAFGLATKSEETATVGMDAFWSNYTVAPLLLLTGLDFLLPGMFVSCLILWSRKRRLEAGLLAASLVMAMLACLIVFDMSRTTCYLFPGVLLLFGLLGRYEPRRVQAIVLGFFLVANLLLPPIFSVGQTMLWLDPLPLKLIHKIFAAV